MIYNKNNVIPEYMRKLFLYIRLNRDLQKMIFYKWHIGIVSTLYALLPCVSLELSFVKTTFRIHYVTMVSGLYVFSYVRLSCTFEKSIFHILYMMSPCMFFCMRVSGFSFREQHSTYAAWQRVLRCMFLHMSP